MMRYEEWEEWERIREDYVVYRNKYRPLRLGQRELWVQTDSIRQISDTEVVVTSHTIPFRAKYCPVSFSYPWR